MNKFLYASTVVLSMGLAIVPSSATENDLDGDRLVRGTGKKPVFQDLDDFLISHEAVVNLKDGCQFYIKKADLQEALKKGLVRRLSDSGMDQ